MIKKILKIEKVRELKLKLRNIKKKKKKIKRTKIIIKNKIFKSTYTNIGVFLLI